MNLKNPVGETVTWWDTKLTVVGVIQNMVMNNPYDEPRPTIFNLSTEEQSVTIAKIDPSSNAKDALTKIEAVYKKFEKDQLFDYKFVDEEYAKKFSNEERVGKLASFFAILAIAISCLGLFGLASFVADQKRNKYKCYKIFGE